MAWALAIAPPAAAEQAETEAPTPEEVGEAAAQTDRADADDADLEELVVRARRPGADLVTVPLAVSELGRDDVQLGLPTLTLGESLAAVPGVYVQNRANFAQDARISIRGFGARASFGLRGIRLYVDGIPQTLPDGQGQVDSLNLPSVGRIEVMRGPASTLYGSAAGGVILVETETPGERPEAWARAAYGSFNTQIYDAKVSAKLGDVDLVAAGGRQSVRGYRDHARMETNQAVAKAIWRVSDDFDVTAVTQFVYAPTAEDPGGLTAADAEDDPTQAWGANVDRNAGESVWQATGGLLLRRAWSDTQETIARGYFTWREFDGRLPIETRGQIDLQRAFGGGALQHEVGSALLSKPNRLIVGVEGGAQRDDRQRYENLIGGIRGDLQLDQDEHVSTVRVFLSDEWTPVEDVQVGFGLSYDHLFYSVDDQLQPGGVDGSGTRDFGRTNPMATLGWTPVDWANPYFRYATSFEPPTTTELGTPTGTGFNPDLDATRAQSWEVGVKGRIAKAALGLRYELAGYHIDIEDELVPQDSGGNTFYVNAGRSKRSGFEAWLVWEPAASFRARFAYAFGISTFTEFELGGNDFAGNRVPGIPDHVVNFDVRWEHSSGFWLGWDTRWVDAIPVNNANTERAPAYAVHGLRGGWRGTLPGRFDRVHFEPWAAVENVTDERYVDNVRINAFGGRFYEPAPALGAMIGARIGGRF